MIDAPVREGEVLAGKYRVERVLGAGGMGMVVAAWHLKLEERVALKFLLPQAARHGEIVARFAREAQAAAKIKSEHVARVTDVGTLDGGEPYLVMEFLDGVDLAGLLNQRGALAIEDAAEYVLQACEAIAEAHSIGIVHRDLKPANLFLTRRHDGSACVKVLDFGISKVTGQLATSDVAMTATQAMLGSPLYMSPEQMISAKSVDHRTDIWSLGVILYELLTAVPPFNGETVAELAVRVTNERPRPMRDLRPDLPAGLERVVLACLEKDAGKRTSNVGELAVTLAEFAPKRARVSAERASRMMRAAGLSGSALVLPPSSDAGPVEQGPQGVTAAAWGKTRSRVHSGRTGLTLLSLATVGAVAAGAWRVFWSPTPEEHSESPPIASAPMPLPGSEPTPASRVTATGTPREAVPTAITSAPGVTVTPSAAIGPRAESLPSAKPGGPGIPPATLRRALEVAAGRSPAATTTSQPLRKPLQEEDPYGVR